MTTPNIPEGEMFGASAVSDVSMYVYVVRYIVHQQAVNVCGQVYCPSAGRHSGSELNFHCGTGRPARFLAYCTKPIIVSNQGRNLRMHSYLYM